MKLDSGELALTMAASQGEKTQTRGDQENAQLLKLAKAGDAQAFEQIIFIHQRLVLMTAWRLLGELADAKDAAQEVFLRLHKYIARFDEERQFVPWLYRMTVNICRDFHRRRTKLATFSLSELSRIEEKLQMLSPHDPATSLAHDEEKQIMREGLRTLSPREREVIVLRDIEGLSTKEVARLLRSTQVTVRSQLCMARIKLKKFPARSLRRQV